MQSGGRLTDLDELLLRCRDSQSKAFLAEAIACYHAGAYRSAIISTWIAVVFDLIGKFKALKLTGDTEATNIIEELERTHQTNDITAALRFEREILQQARETFQFISFIEQEDLQRLFDDRNRCAHPSFRSLEEAYQPSGEQVRTHIYNAVTALLQHPPAHGRKALQSILNTIVSDTFPTDRDRALNLYFKHSPLANARPTLIKDVIAVLTKHLILEQLPEAERLRTFTALLAVLEMYHQLGERILQGELTKIMRRDLTYTNFANLLLYIQKIPSSWHALDDAGKDKMLYYLESAPEDQIVKMMPVALEILALRETARQRLTTFSNDNLAQLIQQGLHLEHYFPEALERWKQSSLYEESKKLTQQFLVPFLSKNLTAEQFVQIIQICAGNSQLHDNHFPTVRVFRSEVFPLTEAYLDETKDAWITLYEQFHTFMYPDKLARRSDLRGDQEPLLNAIENRYPDAISISTKRAQEKYIPETWDL
jgi:hypothetical protein